MDNETALRIYKTMVLIREFEEKLFYLFSTRPMPGSMHQYNGEEAVAAGVCAHLSREDYVTSTHRGHGHCIAKGADLNAVMAEMFAKSTGCCKGMGGSMHIADYSAGMLGANAIVGAGIPIAAGAAWTCQYLENGNVSAAFFGDGAANEGAFHEALNLAAVWKLPVIFVCENNLYGFSTHYKRAMAVDDISVRAASYGMPGRTVDGMDPEAVYEAAGAFIASARAGNGPALLECRTYRFRGHSRFEPANYRTREEVDLWKERDPVSCFRESLLGRGLEPGILTSLDEQAREEVEEAVRFAEASPDPGPGDYKKYIFA
ncbi:MAG: thiamine pyrophosphate-dependent dehydrogenase E1 component subunit alpha [Spirochaetales bacterium]|nr:MAG: thiamine pyrophosphate-dependent dehydrogenase E1 component subunit alpha [Spirochaetales bacterium]